VLKAFPPEIDPPMQTISTKAALIYIMVIVSAADGAMNDEELHAIGEITRTLPVFDGFDADKLIPTARDCSAILQDETGLQTALGLVKEAVPEGLRETAYWLALEIALTDHAVRLEEVRIVETIRRALELDKLTAAALERGVQARFKAA
jgi:tellurite resistance protein